MTKEILAKSKQQTWNIRTRTNQIHLLLQRRKVEPPVDSDQPEGIERSIELVHCQPRYEELDAKIVPTPRTLPIMCRNRHTSGHIMRRIHIHTSQIDW